MKALRAGRTPLLLAMLAFVWATQLLPGRLPAVSASDGVVWQWFDACASGAKMRVNVLHQGKSLYATSFPACARRRSDEPIAPKQKILLFRFKERAALFGEEFRGLGTPDIEGNIWRAGGDGNAILLGVSFVAGDHILLNTI